MAIPLRPKLPEFLENAVNPPPTPAPPPAPAAPVYGAAPYMGGNESAATYEPLVRARNAFLTKLQGWADAGDWPDWIRAQYGLPNTGRDAAITGLEGMVNSYRSGASKDLSQQAINWAQQVPYLQRWAQGKTANVPDAFPILNSLVSGGTFEELAKKTSAPAPASGGSAGGLGAAPAPTAVPAGYTNIGGTTYRWR